MRIDKQHVQQVARARRLLLQPVETTEGRKLSGDRAALARLRRASNPLAAAAEPATLDLYRKLDPVPGGAGWEAISDDLARVAVLASVLAHVREDDKKLVGRALGPPPGAGPEEAVLKSLRMRRLMAARGNEEIGTAFRRAVALLDGRANVGLEKNTILAFSTDNGTENFTWPDGGQTPFAGGKGMALRRFLVNPDDHPLAGPSASGQGRERPRCLRKNWIGSQPLLRWPVTQTLSTSSRRASRSVTGPTRCSTRRL